MASSWFSLYSTIKMMHGPINIRYTTLISISDAAVFFPVHFSLLLFTPISVYVLLISTCTVVEIFIENGYRNNFVIYLGTSCIHRRHNKALKKKKDTAFLMSL